MLREIDAGKNERIELTNPSREPRRLLSEAGAGEGEGTGSRRSKSGAPGVRTAGAAASHRRRERALQLALSVLWEMLVHLDEAVVG